MFVQEGLHILAVGHGKGAYLGLLPKLLAGLYIAEASIVGTMASS